MEQLKLTKSEKIVYSCMRAMVKYQNESPKNAAQELLDIIAPDDTEIMLDGELENGLAQTDDIALMAKMLVAKYPMFKNKGVQDSITEELNDSDIQKILHNAFIEAMSKEHSYYFKEAKWCMKDDKETAYCTFTLPKPHTFHLIDEDIKVKTKVLHFMDLDFCVGKGRFVDEFYGGSDELQIEDYLWLIDAVPAIYEGTTKYYNFG